MAPTQRGGRSNSAHEEGLPSSLARPLRVVASASILVQGVTGGRLPMKAANPAVSRPGAPRRSTPPLTREVGEERSLIGCQGRCRCRGRYGARAAGATRGAPTRGAENSSVGWPPSAASSRTSRTGCFGGDKTSVQPGGQGVESAVRARFPGPERSGLGETGDERLSSGRSRTSPPRSGQPAVLRTRSRSGAAPRRRAGKERRGSSSQRPAARHHPSRARPRPVRRPGRGLPNTGFTGQERHPPFARRCLLP